MSTAPARITAGASNHAVHTNVKGADRTQDALAGTLLPSFGSVISHAPPHVDVAFAAVSPSALVNQPLFDAFKLLAEMHAKVPHGEVYPPPLTRAWYILDNLAFCPISLERYEALRRRDPREYTLKYRMEKMAYINWDSLPYSLRGALMLVWPRILQALGSAYSSLMECNPKWWSIAETVIDGKKPLAVVLPTRLAAQGLRDELFIEFGWAEHDSATKIRSMSEARGNDECFDHIQLLGSWKEWQRPLIFGLLPSHVDVLGYEYEACVLDKRLRSMQTDLDVTIPDATLKLLTHLLGPQAVVQRERGRASIDWNADAIRAARTGMALRWRQLQGNQDRRTEASDDEDLIYELAAESLGVRLPDLSPGDSAEDAEELVDAVTILFTDGTSLVMRADRELLVLPRNKPSTEQRFATDLRADDQVLVFTTGEQHDVFATTLARTQHLLQTDLRVMDYWRNALVLIRQQYPPEVWGKGAEFCEALEKLGCTRDRVTMRGWLSGSTMAPNDQADVALTLRIAGVRGDVEQWARLISKEINTVRNFNRKIGRRIVQRMLKQGVGTPPTDRIDQEIDELLESAELRLVLSVSCIMKQAKAQLSDVSEEDET